jgi:hypothetical protein
MVMPGVAAVKSLANLSSRSPVAPLWARQYTTLTGLAGGGVAVITFSTTFSTCWVTTFSTCWVTIFSTGFSTIFSTTSGVGTAQAESAEAPASTAEALRKSRRERLVAMVNLLHANDLGNP